MNGNKKATKRSRSRKLNTRAQKICLVAKRVILGVIALSMLLVILMILFMVFTTPEKAVTGKIETIVADYYENYFYDRIQNYENLTNYTESGFSKVTLRQLLLFDSERHADAADLLTKYCDSEGTYIRIYPEEPFSRQDYRVEYNYACKF